MAQYGNWDALARATQKKLNNTLEKIKPQAVEIVKQHIKDDIYNAYTPKVGAWVNGTTYKRRGMLKRVSGTISKAESTLYITNNATPSSPIIKGYSFRPEGSGAFLKMLSVGKMGIFKRGTKFPRPALENAVAEMENSESFHRHIQLCIDSEFK